MDWIVVLAYICIIARRQWIQSIWRWHVWVCAVRLCDDVRMCVPMSRAVHRSVGMLLVDRRWIFADFRDFWDDARMCACVSATGSATQRHCSELQSFDFRYLLAILNWKRIRITTPTLWRWMHRAMPSASLVIACVCVQIDALMYWTDHLPSTWSITRQLTNL